jgi:hypothetical protein
LTGAFNFVEGFAVQIVAGSIRGSRHCEGANPKQSRENKAEGWIASPFGFAMTKRAYKQKLNKMKSY